MVKLVDYNPEWEQRFFIEKKRMIDVIGDKVSGIEHIGSTSIKGMPAKPIIDILVGISDVADAFQLIEPFSTIQYEYVHKPELIDRRFFRKGEWGRGTCHVHVCEYHSKEWKEKIWFRDYLSEHPPEAKQYAMVKRTLAVQYAQDRALYSKSKEPFIQAVIEKARIRYEQ
ncbi:GrpB family protein [Longirhabdus pacifica]|uniref:GrpB family protein n=1 Tax=Longirhabdus pacifica TaxID=2305227 RepID=UPI001F0BDFFB|nr:GrpB family protein [Longirhabdus pacifica]